MKKVSILMLTYNRVDFIKESIDGILSQTYKNFELIIIDDGSTDNTENIIKEHSDSRIQYIQHKENKGLLIRRQESLSYASGDYVAVCDSDDIWLPEKLEKQVTYMEEHTDCAIVGTQILLIDQNGNSIKKNSYKTKDFDIRNIVLWRNQFAHSAVLMRKNILDKTLGYRFPLDEDLDLFLQLGTYGTFANLSEALTKYRIHIGGTSHNRLAMLKNVLDIIEVHKNEYSGYVAAKLKYNLAFMITYFKKRFL